MLAISLNSLGLLISNRQQNSAITFVVWIVIGLVVGYVVARYSTGETDTWSVCSPKYRGCHCRRFLSQPDGKPGIRGLDLYSMLVALVGAVVFLIVYHALFRRRRFLKMS
jgi:uncharacterized membrane protein YeaQ/YmgE (transglycosylase-associated protein family)